MKSPLIFRVFKNEQIFVVKQFVDKDQITIGHDAEVDIDLDSNEISAIHCLVEKRGQQFFICDLGSTQGTFKNNQSILDESINSGDEFNVGPYRIVFFVGTPKPVTVPKPVSETVIEPVPLVPAASVKEAVESMPPKAQAKAVEPQPLKKPAVTAQPLASSEKVATLAEKPKLQSDVVVQRGSPQRHNLSPKSFSKSKKGVKTFAPASEISDLRNFIKPGKGSLVEVIVSWKERIINTYHFAPMGLKKLGKNSDIQIPDGSAPADFTFLDLTQGAQVRSSSDMKVEILRDGNLKLITDRTYQLQQNETVFVSLLNGMQLIVRFAPVAPIVAFESPLILSSSEFTGILAALIIAALTSLIVSVTLPKASDKDEDVQRVAQVIFTKPPVPVNKPPVEIAKVQPTPPKPPEPIKTVVKAAEKREEQKLKGDPLKAEQKSETAQSAGRTNEVKPKDSKLKAKMFTSTKQGGAIKTSDKSAANAKSKEADLTNSGLLAAFGSGGARSKLDKAYSGTGELLGQGEKATGSSGFSENRAGDDLGSKFKDTGAGGKGTATQGIAGIGTKGRGTGMSAYGSGTGFGSKDQVAIQAGGAEEAFSGSIDKEAVRRVVKSALNSFKACYEREYKKDSKLEGKVMIAWEIHEKGLAKNARVIKEKSSINNATVEECVRSRLVALRFPEPPAGTFADVTYPFVFQGQK